MKSPAKGQPLVTGLLRGLAVLRCFDLGRERLGSSDIARMTGLPQPTVWRLCRTLEHGGYLIADPDGARWRPGLAILTLGYAALDTLELNELARPLLEDIAARFHGAVSLSIREGAAMLYVQRCEAAGLVLTINLRAGSEVPIVRSGTGWAYLAGRDAEQREVALRECRKADPSLFARCEKHVHAAIARFAKDGYVTNADTFLTGMTTVAVPLATPETDTPFVLNCTCASAELATDAKRKAAGRALLQAAAILRPVAARLGPAG